MVNKKMELTNILQDIPDVFSFITIRKEKSGGFIFNPFLFNEIALDDIEIRVIELCNGSLYVKDIADFIAEEFCLSERDSCWKTTQSINKFINYFAINWCEEKKNGALPQKADPSNNNKETQENDTTEQYYSAPLSVIFELTNSCNLKCKHCLVDAGAANNQELSFADIKKIIDQLHELKVLNINFGGGEPLLRPDLFDILQYTSNLNIGVMLSTNGFLVTDSVLEKLEDINTFAVQISVDGLEKTHDSFRGVKGSFKRAVTALKLFSDKGYFTTMSTMMLHNNINEIESLIKLAVSNGVSSFKLSTFMPAGRADDNKNEFQLSPVELKNLSQKLLILKKQYAEVIEMDTKGTFPWLLENKPQKDTGGFPERHTQIGCSAGRTNLTISATGEAYACPFFRNFPVGNLRTEKLKDLWNTAEVFSMFRNLNSKNLKGKCKNCEYLPYFCQGGCRAAAFLQTGDFYAEDPHCWYGCN